ncbi:MAG: hypothetical protein R3D59_03510 [Paracoccaceae bacterium]
MATAARRIERQPNKPHPGLDDPWRRRAAGRPQMIDEGHAPPDQEMDVTRLMKVWQGLD